MVAERAGHFGEERVTQPREYLQMLVGRFDLLHENHGYQYENMELP